MNSLKTGFSRTGVKGSAPKGNASTALADQDDGFSNGVSSNILTRFVSFYLFLFVQNSWRVEKLGNPPKPWQDFLSRLSSSIMRGAAKAMPYVSMDQTQAFCENWHEGSRWNTSFHVISLSLSRLDVKVNPSV